LCGRLHAPLHEHGSMWRERLVNHFAPADHFAHRVSTSADGSLWHDDHRAVSFWMTASRISSRRRECRAQCFGDCSPTASRLLSRYSFPRGGRRVASLVPRCIEIKRLSAGAAISYSRAPWGQQPDIDRCCSHDHASLTPGWGPRLRVGIPRLVRPAMSSDIQVGTRRICL
jgi:hypothetical protein